MLKPRRLPGEAGKVNPIKTLELQAKVRHEMRCTNRMIARWNEASLSLQDRLYTAVGEIDRLQEEILVLQTRVHNQRIMLRKNWEIIEMRAQYKRAWYPSKLLTSLLRRGSKVSSPATD
jgi:hypothetical protein